MKTLAVVAGLAALAAAHAAQTRPAPRTFTGTITDGMCERGDHSRMRMGPTDAECARACVEEHDAAFVLADGKTVYGLSDQQAPAAFAGTQVKVTGTLDETAKTIRVESIAAFK